LRPDAQTYIYAFMRDDLDLIQGTWAVAELQMEETISGGMLANARVKSRGVDSAVSAWAVTREPRHPRRFRKSHQLM
jgi:hypothetical protein